MEGQSWVRRWLQEQDAFLKGGREFISGHTLVELRLLDKWRLLI